MKKLSEYKDEEALDLLADLIEPAVDIMGDPEIAAVFREKKPVIKAIKPAIKNHKSSVIEILAILDGVPVSEFSCNILTLPARLLEILNDKELVDFFSKQGQMITEESSGSAMENIEEKEQ